MNDINGLRMSTNAPSVSDSALLRTFEYVATRTTETIDDIPVL